MACFAFLFLSLSLVALLFVLLSFRFPLLSCFRPALLLCFVACFLSCSLGLWVCLCCGCWLSFPFGRLQIQKEGARVASLPAVLVCSYFYKIKFVFFKVICRLLTRSSSMFPIFLISFFATLRNARASLFDAPTTFAEKSPA